MLGGIFVIRTCTCCTLQKSTIFPYISGFMSKLFAHVRENCKTDPDPRCLPELSSFHQGVCVKVSVTNSEAKKVNGFWPHKNWWKKLSRQIYLVGQSTPVYFGSLFIFIFIPFFGNHSVKLPLPPPLNKIENNSALLEWCAVVKKALLQLIVFRIIRMGISHELFSLVLTEKKKPFSSSWSSKKVSIRWNWMECLNYILIR